MSKQHIHIGVEDANRGLERFIEAWHKAEASNTDKVEQPEIHLNFEDLSMLASLLTPKRFELMKELRQSGPLSVRALSSKLKRNYKNVHVDVSVLEKAELIKRNEEGLLLAPWDVIDAHMRLVA